jgi:DNA-binding Lrp family transcriptional regulator
MNKNTVRSALTAKPGTRQRHPVETAEFDGFVRRILRAYARRVAAGDVEALRSLAQLSSEVDAVTRRAVAGLREAPYLYSWSEIADRLGVTKQTAHERYGERAGRGVLDSRLLEAGMGISVAALVEVFADHHPGSPAATVCPGCGYRYPDGVTDCPTLATVRPLLVRRRGEDPDAVAHLSSVQFADLHHRITTRLQRAAVRQAASLSPSPDRAPALFDHNGKDPAR